MYCPSLQELCSKYPRYAHSITQLHEEFDYIVKNTNTKKFFPKFFCQRNNIHPNTLNGILSLDEIKIHLSKEEIYYCDECHIYSASEDCERCIDNQCEPAFIYRLLPSTTGHTLTPTVRNSYNPTEEVYDELEVMYNDLNTPCTNPKGKGDKLEKLFIKIFQQTDYFSFLGQNIHTKTNELDVVFTLTKKFEEPLLNNFIRPYLFIESKNVNSTVGTTTVLKLKGILETHGVKNATGIIGVSKHISPEAIQNIRDARYASYSLLVINGEKLRRIVKERENLFVILQECINEFGLQ